MRRLLLILFVIITSCEKETADQCIDPAKKESAACTYIYDPVCGCNKITYGNECEARGAGVLSWKKGACPE